MSATPATVNDWLDELSLSIINTASSSPLQPRRKLQDTFRRRVKRHNFGRTNQFEVAEHLQGLEEKFQILALDNLSDALRQRRNELQDYGHLWLPDILDLFLRLSGEPARNQKLLDLYRIPKRPGTPPPLRWRDLIADDPIDKHDRLWRVPDFHDTDDSENDDSELSSSRTSPQPVKSKCILQEEKDPSTLRSTLQSISFTPGTETRPVADRYEGDSLVISERTYLAQVLLMLQGFECEVYVLSQSTLQLRQNLSVDNLADSALRDTSAKFLKYQKCVKQVCDWIKTADQVPYMNAMKEQTELIFRNWCASLGAIEKDILDPDHHTVLSVSSCLDAIESAVADLQNISSFVGSIHGSDSLASLEALFDSTERAQLQADRQAYENFHIILISVLTSYLTPLLHWILWGSFLDNDTFFIEQDETDVSLTRLWQDKFKLQLAGTGRPPCFLLDTVSQILACGKTSAFLVALGLFDTASIPEAVTCTSDLVLKLVQGFDQPLSATLEMEWRRFLFQTLSSRTETLKTCLQSHCYMYQTLDNLDLVYLGQGGSVFIEFQEAIFRALDRDIASWNDRYRLMDVLAEALKQYSRLECLNAISIHSSNISTPSDASDRSSVRVLNAFALQYHLSWPLANIIDGASLKVYRRASLMLMRVGRAKYCLETSGYSSVKSKPLDDDATPQQQRYVQVLAFRLLSTVNTLQDYLLVTTIQPASVRLRRDLKKASTVDAMIETHKNYVTNLDFSCLVAPQISTLRQSLVTILDLCIKFSDLVSAEKKSQTSGSDHDSNSFTSARSRARTFRAEHYGSDSEDSEMTRDGYSTFIVLDREISVFDEIIKVEARFKKHLKFFIAGLEGASKAGSHVQNLQLLAERLDWLLV